VYGIDGKAPTLLATSGGHTQPKILQRGRGYNKGGLKAIDGKTPTISTSAWEHNNHLTFNEGLTWRKLSPAECERLQTVPEGYTDHVSNTQRYKMLGNGFTVDVIAHLLSPVLRPKTTMVKKNVALKQQNVS
jgi:site-specific DNA-cytosine methylase